MKAILRTSIVLLAGFTLLTGVAYPLAITFVAQLAFPRQANGSMIVIGGQAVGSELIGQAFDDPKLFWSRPSATSPVPYNAAASSGSNLGPTNGDWLDAVKKRIETLRKAHPDQSGAIPGDLVTASASGLDPHISPAAAEFQVTRVARVRGMTAEAVRQLVAAHTLDRTFGVLGEPRVHVLRLNIALGRGEK